MQTNNSFEGGRDQQEQSVEVQSQQEIQNLWLQKIKESVLAIRTSIVENLKMVLGDHQVLREVQEFVDFMTMNLLKAVVSGNRGQIVTCLGALSLVLTACGASQTPAGSESEASPVEYYSQMHTADEASKKLDPAAPVKEQFPYMGSTTCVHEFYNFELPFIGDPFGPDEGPDSMGFTLHTTSANLSLACPGKSEFRTLGQPVNISKHEEGGENGSFFETEDAEETLDPKKTPIAELEVTAFRGESTVGETILIARTDGFLGFELDGYEDYRTEAKLTCTESEDVDGEANISKTTLKFVSPPEDNPGNRLMVVRCVPGGEIDIRGMGFDADRRIGKFMAGIKNFPDAELTAWAGVFLKDGDSPTVDMECKTFTGFSRLSIVGYMLGAICSADRGGVDAKTIGPRRRISFNDGPFSSYAWTPDKIKEYGLYISPHVAEVELTEYGESFVDTLPNPLILWQGPHIKALTEGTIKLESWVLTTERDSITVSCGHGDSLLDFDPRDFGTGTPVIAYLSPDQFIRDGADQFKCVTIDGVEILRARDATDDEDSNLESDEEEDIEP